MNIMFAFDLWIYWRSFGDSTNHSDAELLTQNNTGLTLRLAINYGGRDEIV